MRVDLTNDEHLVMTLRPHWKALVRPTVVLVIAAGLAAFAWTALPDESWRPAARWAVVLLALAVIGWLSVGPWLRWLTTHIIITNERLLYRRGIVRRVGQGMPLYRVNDVAFEQSLLDRMLRCGTLVVSSGGERGQIELPDIPKVAHVQHVLHDLLDADRIDEPEAEGRVPRRDGR